MTYPKGRYPKKIFSIRLQDGGYDIPFARSAGLMNYYAPVTVERRLYKRLSSGPVSFVNLEGEKEFNDDHREEITDFVQSIPGFQE
ncbi:hypothetical protein TNCV_1719591 [Trichonephila clavipes]|nr:hypothetical protein TNCV_1440811 [Trichonephila clavipes]GFU12183.1 hypothetical protein TNCV_1719591 [Trichonephila clavipes]